MPANKKHHYVPRFLLKKFSIRAEDKAINIYNIPNQKIIPNGKLKTQAYKDYLYGRDGKIENVFGELETDAARILRYISYGKAYSAQDYVTLLMFINILQSRTLYALAQEDELVDRLSKISLSSSNNNNIKSILNAVTIKPKNTMSFILTQLMSIIPATFDLHSKIFVNNTMTDFIISDNPVIYYNRFLESRTTHGSNVGLASKGLQIFLPVSPRCTLVFFDPDTYVIGKLSEWIINLHEQFDINGLNYLQCVSAYNNIYFNENISYNYVYESIARSNKYRNERMPGIKEYSQVIDSRKSLVHIYRNDIKTNLNLSVVRITKRAKLYRLEDGVCPVRNEERAREIVEFTSAVEQGKYAPNDLDSFLRDKEKDRV